MAASGFQAEKCLNDTIEKNKGKYIVLWKARCRQARTASIA
jgi:Ni,Fe-hydrogenase I small subunit